MNNKTLQEMNDAYKDCPVRTSEYTIDGKKYTANAGDVLFVPSGSKVIWGSPDKARVFYATYPANWADLL